MRAMVILWPSFLMAGVLETLVFALVDPGNLHWFGGAAVELSPSGVYTLAFLAFWCVISTSSALTQLLELSADDVNRPESQAPGPGDTMNSIRRPKPPEILSEAGEISARGGAVSNWRR
jgi:hypothetical protein